MDATVFIVDDDESARSSLLFLLRAEGLRCRAFPSAARLLEVLEPESSGCIVTDVRMPELDGMGLLRRLNEVGCRLPVILMTGHADVPNAVQAMKWGAVDFIEKPFKSETMLGSIRAALDKTAREEARETERATLERRRARLTEREVQVMEHLALGRANKEIGQILNISHRTVEIYRMNLMAKMHADNLADLVRMVLKLEGNGA